MMGGVFLKLPRGGPIGMRGLEGVTALVLPPPLGHREQQIVAENRSKRKK